MHSDYLPATLEEATSLRRHHKLLSMALPGLNLSPAVGGSEKVGFKTSDRFWAESVRADPFRADPFRADLLRVDLPRVDPPRANPLSSIKARSNWFTAPVRPLLTSQDSYLTATTVPESDIDSSISSESCCHHKEWLDVPELSDSDVEWPDFSRWTRRPSSSASTLTDAPLDRAPEVADLEPGIVANAGEPLAKKPVPETSSAAAKPAPPSTGTALSALHPAKTGFALWVGNLSPRTTLPDLCELFGSPDLQSIYLIQRTGCAFVNYTDRAALEQGMALVGSRGPRLHEHDLVTKPQVGDDKPSDTVTPGAYGAPTRYFVCKSLTVGDLDQAKKSGRWSTQLRNRDRLNEAFRTSENTLLVFSANRTSAYYGIARLDAEFAEESVESSAAPATPAPGAAPQVTPTTAHACAYDGVPIPAGELVLDPLRGSQFWKVAGCACVEPEVEKWTAPAAITWLSSPDAVVPFTHTRQLKNSLNDNKPIKVARDGTEIDPAVGRQLCALFQ